MATLVGTQDKFVDALYELCELDFDAMEAYQAAIDRLDDEEYSNQLQRFKADHARHVKEISAILTHHQAKVPTGPSSRNLLTKGKVILANLFGDEAILSAMLTNEQDTNLAYERLNARIDEWADAKDILSKGLADERRHKAWLESILNKGIHKKAA